MRIKRPLVACAPVAVALAVAGCGGAYSSGSASKTSGSTGGSKTAPSGGLGITSSKLGRFLVDGRGQTLYLFESDRTTASTCYSACASVWPPLTSSALPTVQPGVRASELGTAKRSDGRTQVTYGGHPLYYYAGDNAPGQTTGQGVNQFGAGWYVVAPSGARIDHGS